MNRPERILSGYLFILGLSAVYGGLSIIFSDVMNFPPDILETTPFDSFWIPGLLLTFVVGGTQFLAAVLLWIRNKYMYEATAVAGFGLLIWMSTEIYMIPSHHPVQIVYMGFAILTLVSVMLMLKYKPYR